MSDSVKIPKTQNPVNESIIERWSPRAFAKKPISAKDMATLFEAASWAFSASNTQPWQYVYAHAKTKGFDALADCLLPGNKLWADKAAVLVVSLAEVKQNDKDMPWAKHDVGAANATLALQAISQDIYCHPMGGFDADKVTKLLDLDSSLQPVAMIALGYLGDADKLEEPFLTREKTPRTRKSVTEFTKELNLD